MTLKYNNENKSGNRNNDVLYDANVYEHRDTILPKIQDID